MSSMGNERKLTPEQEDEIVREYVESRIDPEREPVRQVDLAKKYGEAQSTISNTINNSGVMERMRRRTKASVAIAQAMAEAAAPKVMRETVIDALKEREDEADE